MPNTSISVYLTDEEYVRYVKNKKGIHKEVRELIKKRVKNAGAVHL